jgi:hypothetical protein
VGTNSKEEIIMCDFEDDFDNDDFMDEDTEMDDPLDGDSDLDNEPIEAEPQDDEFTAKDAFFAGSFAGWAHEESLRERKRKKGKKFSDDSD